MTERWAEPLDVEDAPLLDVVDETPEGDEPDEELLAFLDAPVRPIETSTRALTPEQLAAQEWIEDLRRYSKSQPRGKDGEWRGTGGGSGGAAQGGGDGGKAAKPGDPIKLRDGTTIRAVARSGLSNPDTPRTRGVSREEFTALANEGHARLGEFRRNGGPPDGLDRNMRAVKDHAYEQVQGEWGGGTYDAHTGKPLAGDADKYALTVKPPGVDSVSVPIGASKAEFDGAMDSARQRFDGQLQGQNAHLGVFRDEDVKRIDIDPVLVVDNHHDVETIGSATHAVGGAFRFSDGNGYWPPYVEGA
jgi:hypothetical protein